MKTNELRNKNIEELRKLLFNLLHNRLNLSMQKKNQLQKTHLLKEVRRNIARIKTIFREKLNEKKK